MMLRVHMKNYSSSFHRAISKELHIFLPSDILVAKSDNTVSALNEIFTRFCTAAYDFNCTVQPDIVGLSVQDKSLLLEA